MKSEKTEKIGGEAGTRDEVGELNNTIQTLIAERDAYAADRDQLHEQLIEANRTVQVLISERDQYATDRSHLHVQLTEANRTVQVLISERDQATADRNNLHGQLTEAISTSQVLILERDQYIKARDDLYAELQQTRRGEGLPFDAETIGKMLRRSFGHFSHEDRLVLFKVICERFGEYFLSNGVFQLAAFNIAEEAGLHLLPVHYYSPTATKAEVATQSGKNLFSDDFGVEVDKAKQLKFYDETVRPYLPELLDVPFENPNISGTFFWRNGMFGPQDASTYYGVIRTFKPKNVLEVGSGFSTLAAALAASKNDDTTVTCIEPFPVEFFSQHLKNASGYELIEKMVQDVDLDYFKKLQSGDILFIDSSHVAKPGSDVEHIIFRILPALSEGVIVHFHDIFMPRGYGDYYYNVEHRHWNENYLLAAFLARNPDWEVLIVNAYAADYDNKSLLQSLSDDLAGGDRLKRDLIVENAGGGSMWIRRKSRRNN